MNDPLKYVSTWNLMLGSKNRFVDIMQFLPLKQLATLCSYIRLQPSLKRRRSFIPLHKKVSFQLRIAPVNVTKLVFSCGFGWSHLPEKSLMENFSFCAVFI